METATQEQVFDQFASEIDSFPASLETSAITYNTGKLVKILQEKEVMEVCGIGKAEFDLINEIDFELGKVVVDILKEGNLPQSIEDYNRLEQRIEESFAGNLYLYAKQVALSVKSLYFYKMKDFDKAIAITLECNALNDYLIQQGIFTLNLRCLEQNKNISRIHFRAEQSESGHTLLNHLLHYLLTGEDRGLYGNIFKLDTYYQKTPVLRETYTYEMFTMLAEDMIRFHYKNHRDYFPNQWYAGLDFEVDTPDRQIIYNWMYINNILHEGKLEEFFESLIYFLGQPISHYYDIFKISLVLDTWKLLLKSDYAKKNEAIEKIKSYLNTKLILHEKLRDHMVQHFGISQK